MIQLGQNYKILNLIARILLSSIFINAIPDKINNFEKTKTDMNEKGIPDQLTSILLILTIILLISGSFLLLFGDSKLQAIGALLLIIFLIPAAIIMHMNPLDLYNFFRNLSLIGGLLLVVNQKI